MCNRNQTNKMRKILFLAMLFSATIACYSQNAKQLLDKYGKVEDAEYHHINKIGVTLIKMLGKQMPKGIKHINSVRILDLENFSPQIKEQFNEDVNRLKGYELMISANEDGEQSQILIKEKHDKIKEVLIINQEDDEIDCVLIKGNIKTDELEELTKPGTFSNF